MSQWKYQDILNVINILINIKPVDTVQMSPTENPIKHNKHTSFGLIKSLDVGAC